MSASASATGSRTLLADIAPETPALDRRAVASALRFALAETAAGGHKLVILAGESGSGKTTLAHELLPPVRERGGMLIESRIESLSWGSPLDSLLLGLSQLSQALCQQLSDSGLSGREALLELGTRLGLIQTSSNELDLTQALQLQLLAGELLSHASRELRPLVWIIDGVDQLDQDALAVLDYLIENRSTPYLMILLCVRDAQLPMLVRWQMHELSQLYQLAPFSIRDTMTWLVEEQNINPRLAAEIAPFLQQTCQGNLQLCRFLLDSLAAHNLLSPVPDAQWAQRLQQISLQLRVPEAENHFREQLLQLTETGLEMLQTASLIGLEFDARILHDYLPESAVLEHLALASGYGLIEHLGGTVWRFIHPHLQRLAQQSCPHQHEAELHARLAYRMMKLPQYALQALRHAQQAGPALTQADRVKYAQRGAQVASEILQQGSPLHAAQILEQMMALLGPRLWLDEVSLSEQMIDLWCACLQEPNQYREVLVVQKNLPAEASAQVRYTLSACRQRLALLTQDYAGLFGTAEDALGSLGQDLSTQTPYWSLVRELVLAGWERLRYRPAQQACGQNTPMDSVLRAQRVLAALYGPGLLARPTALAAVTVRQLRLQHRYGRSPHDVVAKIGAALALTALRRYAAAFKLADVAEAEAAALDENQVLWPRHQVPILSLGLIQPWRAGLQQLLPNLWRWQQNALLEGDFEYAGYASMFYIGHSLLNGSPLQHLEREAAKVEDDLRHTRQLQLLPMSNAFRQALYGLAHTSDNPPWLGIGAFLTQEGFAALMQRDDALNLCHFHLLSALTATYCGASDAALSQLAVGWQRHTAVRGSILAALMQYLQGLNGCRMGQYDGPWARRRLNRIRQRLQQWAALNPALFACKAALLEAQYAGRFAEFEQAQAAFLAAIELARQQQQHHDYALATLLYGEYLFGQQHFHHARQLINLAVTQYEHWGAHGVAHYLERRYGNFLLPPRR
ncbi:AAA family ATPase [Chitinibacter tainanensis]|uniref:AAA family ATPase n=1 Tax=Chitinibacter tainanensis TaxID=230667 RepID=UPI00235386F8|nr:AAA family ATPase [Chitinibacter tainanensis]